MKKVDTTDVTAWQEDRVPSDVRKVMIYVYDFRQSVGVGPAWSDIVDYMGWQHLPRDQWRKKFKRMRRWGLRWEMNVPGSTSISRAALPFVRSASRYIDCAV